MRFSCNWLQDFVDCADVPTARLAERLSATGTEVERVLEWPGGPPGVVLARVVELERMPRSDHLWLTRVDAGGPEPVAVVCGAQNLGRGALVPWAPPGTVLPGGTRLGLRRIRGHPSSGMLCSPAELGLGAEREGILLLDGDAAEPGTPLADVVGADRVLELEITANRPDCLSHLGVARELAAALERPLRRPDCTPPPRSGEAARELVRVAIANPDGCPRYCAEVVSGLPDRPAPLWMQQRLRAVGMRPLGLIVDLSNYVCLELGQPLHAFDLERVRPGGDPVLVTVRPARAGEALLGLDGVERVLDPPTVVIDIGGVPSAIAGLIGGMAGAVVASTSSILLEAACFSGSAVRGASRRLGLRTEASVRFEKGLSPELAPVGAARFVHLAHHLGGARVHPGPIDLHPGARPPGPPIRVTGEALGRALGMAVAAPEAARALRRLEFAVQEVGDRLAVRPPPDRLDVTIAADVLEEVGRSLGYDRVPATLPGRRCPAGTVASPAAREAVRELALGAGFDEAITVSLTAPLVADRLRPLAPPWPPIEVRNPLGPQGSVLRLSCLPGLLQAAAANQARGAERVRLFEIGRAFWGPSAAEPPEEPLLIGLVDHVPGGDADEAARRLRRLVALVVGVGGRCADGPPEVRQGRVPGLHAARAAELWAGGRRVGAVGELADGAREALELRGRTVVAELRLDGWLLAGGPAPQARPIASTPALVEDLAVIVPARAALGPALAAFAGGRVPHLESWRLVDEYTDARLGPAHKGWTFRLVYRDPARTLTGAEGIGLRAAAMEVLAEAVGARRRENA